MIAVVDYEMGNVGSVLNMLKKLGVPCKLTRDPHELLQSHGLILPGVGSFDQGMLKLRKHSLIEVLNDIALRDQKPCLGICLGMQLMAAGSEEGCESGLGWIDTRVRVFQPDSERPRLRIPHMGWNFVQPIEPLHPLFDGLPSPLRFYFVHSYHFSSDVSSAVGLTEHIVPFTSALAKGNIFGCQFHPEKSHSFGLRLLSNFNRIATQSDC